MSAYRPKCLGSAYGGPKPICTTRPLSHRLARSSSPPRRRFPSAGQLGAPRPNHETQARPPFAARRRRPLPRSVPCRPARPPPFCPVWGDPWQSPSFMGGRPAGPREVRVLPGRQQRQQMGARQNPSDRLWLGHGVRPLPPAFGPTNASLSRDRRSRAPPPRAAVTFRPRRQPLQSFALRPSLGKQGNGPKYRLPRYRPHGPMHSIFASPRRLFFLSGAFFFLSVGSTLFVNNRRQKPLRTPARPTFLPNRPRPAKLFNSPVSPRAKRIADHCCATAVEQVPEFAARAEIAAL